MLKEDKQYPIRVEDEEGAEDEDEEGGRGDNHFNRFSTLKFAIFNTFSDGISYFKQFLRWNLLVLILYQMEFVTLDIFSDGICYFWHFLRWNFLL